jgi:insertion element IS1 protein InsB
MDCRYCNGPCIKAGHRKNGVQKFRWRSCRKYQQNVYVSNAYKPGINHQIAQLLREGLSIRGIGRVLKLALSTVIERIKMIANKIQRPLIATARDHYEVDELWTFVGKRQNELWIMYAYNRQTKSVADFVVGPRTKSNLRSITDYLLLFQPRKIFTDGLNIYKSLLPPSIHKTGLDFTRHIERYNLNIRTHLKRFSRRTICFSKSVEMIRASLKIYFWYGSIENTLKI